MKLQLHDHRLRVRVDEDELTVLLAGKAVTARTAFGAAFALGGSVLLDEADEASITGRCDDYLLTLPATPVRGLAGRLPSRDGLVFALAGGGELRFDVDVRDSVRRRHA
jgi:hypothetical protein